MSSFTSPLKASPLDNGRDWEILEEFTYFVGELDSNTHVTVPVGFVTDFASVPRMLWSIIPPWGKYGKAAIIHDYLWLGYTMVVEGRQTPVDRKTANLIFLEAMGVLDVNVCIRYPMYWAVCVNAKAKELWAKIKK